MSSSFDSHGAPASHVWPDTGIEHPSASWSPWGSPPVPNAYDTQTDGYQSWVCPELQTATQATTATPLTPQSYDAQSWTDASWYDGSSELQTAAQATTATPFTSPSYDAQACTAVSWGAVSPELQAVTQATTATSFASSSYDEHARTAASWDAGSQAAAPEVAHMWPASWGDTQPLWQLPSATSDASSPQTDDSQGTVTSVDEPARKCARIDDSQPPPPPPPPPQATDPASASSTNQHKGGGWKIKALHLAYVVLHGESSAIQDGASAHKLAKRMSADTRIADDWRRLSASCRNAH